MTLLKLQSVSKTFGGLRALRDVSFEVARGEIVGIMGANGAGKTTLFSLIAGNATPSSGEIWFEGRRIDGSRPDQNCRAGIARTFQIVRPFAGLSVLENVMVAVLYGSSRERSHAKAAARAEEILHELGLEERKSQLAGSLTLSGQKRLEIARALATEPQLILLDEVMAGLTATEVNELLTAIRVIKQRRSLTVVIVEHVMQALMRLADRIVVLHHGEKIVEGLPAAIVEDERVIAAYLGSAS
jgi:branched-chain amino acid transport system ATP-binding protein